MKQGFVKVAAASCAVVVADVRENTRVILETIHKMEGEGAKVMVSRSWLSPATPVVTYSGRVR